MLFSLEKSTHTKKDPGFVLVTNILLWNQSHINGQINQVDSQPQIREHPDSVGLIFPSLIFPSSETWVSPLTLMSFPVFNKMKMSKCNKEQSFRNQNPQAEPGNGDHWPLLEPAVSSRLCFSLGSSPPSSTQPPGFKDLAPDQWVQGLINKRTYVQPEAHFRGHWPLFCLLTITRSILTQVFLIEFWQIDAWFSWIHSFNDPFGLQFLWLSLSWSYKILS